MGIFKTFINQVNGTVGEIEVNAKLNPFFFGKVDHKQINNLVIVDDNGKTHQIDHVENEMLFFIAFLGSSVMILGPVT